MNKKIIKELIKYFNINHIEMELLYQYLKKNNINYSNSKLISAYLSDYTTNNKITTIVNKLEISSIKDLENCMELLIPDNDKKLNGAFFTPSYIIDYIINEIQPKINDSNIDPSCGCGAFLIGLAEYYKTTFNKPIKSTIKENIFGADILEYNIRRTKLIIAIYALQNNEIIEDKDFNLYCLDSLQHDWNQTFTNVVGNPPYVKFQDLTDDNRSYLSSSWSTTKHGAYNLYFAFFELGYTLLGAGKLGYITPNNYFTSIAGEPLRAFFERHRCIDKIIDFNAKKIFDVQTYTAITFLSKNTRDTIQYDKISETQQPQIFLNELSSSVISWNDLNNKKWRLLKTNERNNIYKIENIGESLSSLYDICVGIATLKDSVFFIDGDTFDGKHYHKISSNGKSHKIEPQIVRSVYKTSDFKAQNNISENNRKIICPYIINGTTKLITENSFKEKYPLCYKYLLSERELLEARDKGKKSTQPFYAWGRTQGLSKFGVKLITPTFSKAPRFLKIEEEYSYFTNGYGIFFKPTENLLFKNTNSLSNIENIDVVMKILNSSVMNYYITCTSVAIEGGYPCYQKNFIERFSIPNLSNDEISNIRTLRTEQEIDRFLITKYGLDI